MADNGGDHTDSSTHHQPVPTGYGATNGNGDIERLEEYLLHQLEIAEAGGRRARASLISATVGAEIRRIISNSGPENVGVEDNVPVNADRAEIPTPSFPRPVIVHDESSNPPPWTCAYYKLLSEYHKLKDEQNVILSKLCPRDGVLWEHPAPYQTQIYDVNQRNKALGYTESHNTPESSYTSQQVYRVYQYSGRVSSFQHQLPEPCIDYAYPGTHAALVEIVVRTTISAFGSAMESLRWNVSNISNDNEAERKRQHDRQQEKRLRELADLEPHLQEIYNVWYLAGELTGKYLVEVALESPVLYHTQQYDANQQNEALGYTAAPESHNRLESSQHQLPSNTAAPETRNRPESSQHPIPLHYTDPGSHKDPIGTAMEAFETAMSSLSRRITEISNDNEAGRKNRNDRQQEQIRQLAGLEPNLQEICKAWFLAGVLTEKYLEKKPEDHN